VNSIDDLYPYAAAKILFLIECGICLRK